MAINPLAGIAVDNDYTQAEIDQVKNLVQSGDASIAEVAQNFGVSPSYAASSLGLPLDSIPIKTIDNQSAKDIMKSIPPTGNYTPEQVKTVTDLMNAGQINVTDVSKHFNVEPDEVISVVTEIPKETFKEKNFTPAQVSKLESMVVGGIATAPQVAKYFDAEVSDVTDYLTQNTGLSESQVVDSILSDVKADRDYNMTDVEAVKAQIDAGNVSVSQVSNRYRVSEDEINRFLDQPEDTGGTVDDGTGSTVSGGGTVITDPLNQTSINTGTNITGGADLTGGAADLTYGRQGDDIPTGLTGSETALTGSASDALNLLNSINQAGRTDLTGQTQIGLNDLAAGAATARQDISGGSQEAYNRLVSGLEQGRGDLSTGAERAEQAIMGARDLATGQIQQGTTQGLEAFNQGIGQGRQDITGAFGRAEGMFNPYQQAGTNALQMQQALSGALGQEAFNQAFNESPQMQFLREQGERAATRGAAAAGGIGGGNVLKELTRFGQGLASTELQNQIANLANLSSQGLSATGSAANVATSGGQNLANLAQQQGLTNLQALQSQGQNLANISTSAGQNLANIAQDRGQGLAGLSQLQATGGADLAQTEGQNLANIANTLGVNQLNTRVGLGSNLANYGLSTGLPAASTISNLGVNLAKGRTRAGEQLANQAGSVAQMLGGIQQGQATNLANLTQGQMNYINSLNANAAAAEAAAQQGYSGNQANLLTGTGSTMLGIGNVPSFVPDYGQAVGNALNAAGAGYQMFGNQNTNQQPTGYGTNMNIGGYFPQGYFNTQPTGGVPTPMPNFGVFG